MVIDNRTDEWTGEEHMYLRNTRLYQWLELKLLRHRTNAITKRVTKSARFWRKGDTQLPHCGTALVPVMALKLVGTCL